MIFEGKVDEAEVEKLVIGMPLTVNLGAIQDKDFDAKSSSRVRGCRWARSVIVQRLPLV